MTQSPTFPPGVKALTALPVYNEEKYIRDVLPLVLRNSQDVLIVNDGSNDATAEILANEFPQVVVVTHAKNQGYGAALRTAFDYAVGHGYDVAVTIDCDGQHEPQRIPLFVTELVEQEVDIVSGSRYLKQFEGDSPAPEERRVINHRLTAELNRRLGFKLTDAFCGFKAYSVPALAKFDLQENGYAMPLEVWVQAASLGLQITELPVPRIYLDENRSFGGALDDGNTRLEYYHLTLDRSIAARQKSAHPLPHEIGLPVGTPCESR